jgi:hypothetical protein
MQQHLDEFKERKAARADGLEQEKPPEPPPAAKVFDRNVVAIDDVVDSDLRSEVPESSDTPYIAGEPPAERDDPPVDRPATGDPFYRQVVLNSNEISEIEARVDARLKEDGPAAGTREDLIAMQKDAIFEEKARNGEFFSTRMQGSLESMVDNATASQWYGDSAYLETRLFEVRPTVGTEYYDGKARPQGPTDPTDPSYGERPLHAALSGEGTQVFIPDKSDRESWPVRAIGRDEMELADLPKDSIRGFDENGDLLVSSQESHRADRAVKSHNAVLDENPFEQQDQDAREKAARENRAWEGPIWNRFSGNFGQKVVGGVASAPREPVGDLSRPNATEGDVSSHGEERDRAESGSDGVDPTDNPAATRSDDSLGAASHTSGGGESRDEIRREGIRAARDQAMAARLETAVEELNANEGPSTWEGGSADAKRQHTDLAPFDENEAGLASDLIRDTDLTVPQVTLEMAKAGTKEVLQERGVPPWLVDEAVETAKALEAYGLRLIGRIA